MQKKGTNTLLSLASDAMISRRSFNHGLFVAGLTAATWPFFGDAEASRRGFKVDYIVVGGGAGGARWRPVSRRRATRWR